MSTREAIAHLHAITGNIVGADIVEYNPRQDISQLTATVAGRILKEIHGQHDSHATCVISTANSESWPAQQ